MLDRSPNWFAPILALWLAACSGATADPVLNPTPEGDLDAGGAGGGDSSTPSRDASLPSSCSEISKQLQARREELRTCCPTCKSLQCQQLLPDLCCPFSSNVDPNAAEARQYAALVRHFRESGCSAVCPDVDCRGEPSRRCVGEGSVGQCAE